MKKSKLMVFGASALLLVSLVGCGGGDSSSSSSTGTSSAATSTETSSTEVATEKVVAAKANTKYQKNGAYVSKKDLGDEYGMSGIGKVEWDKQVKALEEGLENKALPVNSAEAGVATATLKTGALVDALKEAVEYSAKQHVGPQESNAKVVQTWGEAVAGGNYAAGIGYTAKFDAKKSQVEVVAAYATFAGENVVDARFDVVQVPVAVVDGKVAVTDNHKEGVTDKGVSASKLELGKHYNMVKFGNSLAEVDEEIEALADYTKGKTAAKFAEQAAKVIHGAKNNEDGQYVGADGKVIDDAPEFHLVSTITATDFATALTKAYTSKYAAKQSTVTANTRAGVGIVVEALGDNAELNVNIVGCMSDGTVADHIVMDDVVVPLELADKAA